MSEPDGGPRQAYEAFAATYDEFNSRYMYERWTGRLLEAARESGLEGDRLLDVGCGTGLSFVSQLERGFEVTGCDISPAMLTEARAKVGDRATLVEADMRELPVLGEFDLIWSVNDAINYLIDGSELTAALSGMRGNLAPGGVIVFDVNTLTGYRDFWSGEFEVAGTAGRSFRWQGLARDPRPGDFVESRFDGDGEGVRAHRHRQRHFAEIEILGAIEHAGLQSAAVLGESGGDLSVGVDEERHTKAVHVCRAGNDG
jgi:SAM-dependent methyltransferase